MDLYTETTPPQPQPEPQSQPGPATPPAGTTVVAEPGEPDRPERRRRTGGFRRDDLLALLGALAGALSFTLLLFTQLAPFDGLIGFFVVGYAAFLVFYTFLVALEESWPAVRDRLASAVVHSIALLLLLALGDVIVYVFSQGPQALRHLNFWTQDLRAAGPLQPLTIGGVRHAMIGTFEQITIALAITVPLGLLCAVFLNELPGRFARFVRTIADAATALPSVVAGLFVYAALIIGVQIGPVHLQIQKGGLAAGLAISVMMLPIIIRAADVVLRLVPGSLKEASYALGAGQWRTVWTVTLPTARSGLATAVILGSARGLGETSPVLLTAGYNTYTNGNPVQGPQTSLPLAVFKLVTSGEPLQIQRAYGAAAVLILVVLVLFITARIIGGHGPGHLTGRQRRARASASIRDLDRILARTAQNGSLP
ncbi:MAG TPA: phosphate ABC transporter permease PstA [Actinocrinis sp.]|uniref:phosphate ABC transporter permease PstA n=1 Tax=Actinocrinis sp. TaxID=1920516 RepID=UPI002D4387D5|nr:phosphate ABC transporter permease PstA [Actinocrinis sp.]HZU56330.1 phosphate ABC transporter permease PstA [Actinocrinis sp.]